MAKPNLQIADEPRIQPGTKAEQFAAYIARVITSKRTPKQVKSVIFQILIAGISNNSGYNWSEDAEAINFMLLRLLDHMNEMYAEGIMDTTCDLLEGLLPEAIKGELFRGPKPESIN